MTVFALLLAGVVVALCRPCGAEEVWRVTSLHWPPYADADMPDQGRSVERLRRLLRGAGIELVVEFYPWARAQDYARDPQYVGYFPAWPSEVRAGFTASLPVDRSGLAVLAPARSPLVWSGLEDLFRRHVVGLVRTYVYPEAVDRLAGLLPEHAQELPHEESLLRSLLRGHIEAAITDPLVLELTAERHGLERPRVLAHLPGQPLVLAFRDDPANRKRLERLNALLRAAARDDPLPGE